VTKGASSRETPWSMAALKAANVSSKGLNLPLLPAAAQRAFLSTATKPLATATATTDGEDEEEEVALARLRDIPGRRRLGVEGSISNFKKIGVRLALNQ